MRATAVAESTTSFREDLVEGARYIWHHAFVRWLMVVFAIIFLLTVAPSFITPLMVARTWGTEVWMVTVLEIAFSVGMVLGLCLSLFVRRRRVWVRVSSTAPAGDDQAGGRTVVEVAGLARTGPEAFREEFDGRSTRIRSTARPLDEEPA